jgi:hypothetical protein
VVKYHYIATSQNKAVLSRFDFRVYKHTTNTAKSRYKQNFSHYRAYQNKKQHRKHKTKHKTPPTTPQKRCTTSENKNRIQEPTPTKRKAPQREKTPARQKEKPPGKIPNGIF